MTVIKTERLTLTPMTDGELTGLIERLRDVPELSMAYGEMLESCNEYPGERLWYAPWRISLPGGPDVGYAGFKGFAGGYPEIGYGLNEGFEGRGYATEAVKALCGWALGMPGVAAVEAEAEADNIASGRVLGKCGFIPTGVMGAEGPRYILTP